MLKETILERTVHEKTDKNYPMELLNGYYRKRKAVEDVDSRNMKDNE